MTARVRVIAIDPGSVKAGYAVVDRSPSGLVTYVECGVLSAPARWPAPKRLVEIYAGIVEVMDEHAPDVGVVERLYLGRNGNVPSLVRLAESRGVALTALGRLAKVHEVETSAARKTVCGNGRASKTEAAESVRLLMGLETTPSPDASDALVLACHVAYRELNQT